jgi:hypothetical protein
MAAAQVGFVRTYAHKKVVILKTGLSVGEENAVMVARLSKNKPPATTPGVEAKTRWGTYWVLTGQVSTVRTADLVTVWWGPDELEAEVMKAVQQKMD